jgi:2-methylcitrate dehydratase PrpD
VIAVSSLLLELGRRAASPASAQAQAPARLHLFDAVVAAVAGATTREGALTARTIENLGACPRETSAADLVLALARRIRATELDDLQLESVTTAAAAVVPALVGAAAIAGKREYGADDLLSAMTAGYDIMHTLGLGAGGPDFLYRQGGWPSLVAAGPAAAATAGRLLGLDPEQIAHAIALAVLSTPRSLRGSGEDGRWLSFGLAVTAGFQAALAARSGSRGDLGLLDQDPSLTQNAGSGIFPGLPDVLARPWEPGRGLAGAHLKQWASAGQVAAAIDAVAVLHDRHGLRAADVTAVDVHVPAAYRRMIDQPSGSGRTWSLVSAQYQVAARLLHPQDRFDCARSALRDSSAFLRLMGVVRVHEEDALAARHPQSYPARVAVTLRNGLTADYLSDGRSPCPHWHWDPLLSKARAVAVRVGAEERIDPLREAIIGFSDSGQFMKAVLPAAT